MRVGIEIDDGLMRQAMVASGAPTKRATVEAALRLLVRLKAQEAALALHGTVGWQGDLDTGREGRDPGFRSHDPASRPQGAAGVIERACP